MGSDMIYPIWPLFVTSVLGADMKVLGLIDGLGDALVSISQAVSGYLSDRFSRRKVFIWTGYIMGSASRVGYAMSRLWWHLIPFRILDRAGKMRGSPRDAIIADVSSHEDRGRNFGLLRAMDNAGAVCGIILSMMLLGTLGYRNLFLLAAIPSLIGAALVFAYIKDRKTTGIYKGLSLSDLDANFKLFLFLSSIFALASFSYSFLLVNAKRLGFADTTIPFFYLIFTVTASITSLPFGRLADKINRKTILGLSYVIYALTCVTAIYAKTYAALIFLFILYGLHKGAIEPVQKTLVSELSPPHLRASTLGAYQMIVGLCALPASFIAGVMWEAWGWWTPFALAVALSFVSAVLMAFVRERNV